MHKHFSKPFFSFSLLLKFGGFGAIGAGGLAIEISNLSPLSSLI